MAPALRRRLARMAARAARRIGANVDEMEPLGGAWQPPADCDSATAAIIRRVQAYTLTPPARIMALCEGIRYLDRAGIDGAIVECGVWRGGSMMAAALTLLELGTTTRDIYLFDTFTEMPPPSDRDSHISGRDIEQLYDVARRDPIYTIYPVERVRELVEETGYPRERLHFVKGLIEETIPGEAPEQIALCRLDTDWYESTAHELEHLYPRMADGGIVIVDDYGEFLGARRAVDEFFAGHEQPPLLGRVDESCRLVVVRRPAPRGGDQEPGSDERAYAPRAQPDTR